MQYSVLAAITRFYRSNQSSVKAGKPGMSAQELTALKALDTLPFGMMFVDKESRVMLMNSTAKNSCVKENSLSVSKDKRVCAAKEDESALLHRMVKEMSQQDGDKDEDENHTVRITDENGNKLTLLLVSVGRQSSEHGVAIFIDSGGGFFNITEETLKSVYGLTQSEAGLLLRMVQGETLAEISEARSVTMHTVRAQLKSVFAKTDTNRQASLIKKVLTGPAVLMRR
jgi:DNA-binding CsgD family transcriptional regulator